MRGASLYTYLLEKKNGYIPKYLGRKRSSQWANNNLGKPQIDLKLILKNKWIDKFQMQSRKEKYVLLKNVDIGLY